MNKQDKIIIGCVLPASYPYVFQWPPLDVSGGGPQVNKFEQVSSDDHQMSLAGGGRVCRGGSTPYYVTYPMMHVMSSTPWTEWQTNACENITFR